MEQYEALKRKQQTLKLCVFFQLIISLLSIIYTLLELFDSSDFQLSDLATRNRILDSSNIILKIYLRLIIHISFGLLAFFGYPGYKYEKSILALPHSLITMILSLTTGIYFLYLLLSSNSKNYLYHLANPSYSLLVSTIGLFFIKDLWSSSPESKNRLKEEPLLGGPCSKCSKLVIVPTLFLCNHMLCERCVLFAKNCPICND